jgi:Fe-S cluster biogenesis protein NfuA
VLFLDIYNYLKKLLKKRTKRHAMIHKALHTKWRKRNPLKDMGDLWCSRKVKSSCSLSGNCHACLLKNITINLIIERRLQLLIKKNSTKNIIIETNVRAIDTKYYNEYNN